MAGKYHNIRVRQTGKEKIKLLAKRNGKNETEYANRMILFIYKSGLDIYSDITPSVPDLIKNLDKRIVSFLKKRESDFFVPMDKSFKKMIELHTRTFEMLEVLDPFQMNLQPRKIVVPETAKPSLKLPLSERDDIPKNTEEETSVLETQNSTFSKDDKEDFLVRIERAEKEKKTFEKELKFLIENIKPNKSISGPKFTCNLPQKEIDRIKLLVGGN
ncbi:hypothetical protein FVB32_05285 [Flagellimonas hymeniacidonis]|uniref:Mobilization protein n=1 Tax=Flagellimonas hymeniacidonis TaxID=2603628 RepID=A0A5C8V7L9_9FLAO|nr:BfmA/BtgA family mobilization protein [Flagellimonas hymeniacidonis]TXN37702.1 hypothetical protein FVB32_05285 [Flagellimonas hymeniacidonis]